MLVRYCAMAHRFMGSASDVEAAACICALTWATTYDTVVQLWEWLLAPKRSLGSPTGARWGSLGSLGANSLPMARDSAERRVSVASLICLACYGFHLHPQVQQGSEWRHACHRWIRARGALQVRACIHRPRMSLASTAGFESLVGARG